jgi:hypothetical protein
MARRKKSKHSKAKAILRLPELEQSRNSVLHSLAAASQEPYGQAIDEFIGWYCSEPRLSLAIPAPFRVPAGTSPRSYALPFNVPESPSSTFWWDTPSAATTCERLRTFTCARLQGWYWLTPIQRRRSRSQCEESDMSG